MHSSVWFGNRTNFVDFKNLTTETEPSNDITVGFHSHRFHSDSVWLEGEGYLSFRFTCITLNIENFIYQTKINSHCIKLKWINIFYIYKCIFYQASPSIVVMKVLPRSESQYFLLFIYHSILLLCLEVNHQAFPVPLLLLFTDGGGKALLEESWARQRERERYMFSLVNY